MLCVYRPVLAAICLAAGAPALAAPPAPAAPVPAAEDPAELAEARAIIGIMFPPAQRLQMMAKMQDDMMAQMAPLLPASLMADPGLKAIMTAYIDQAKTRQAAVLQKFFPQMLEAMASAYTREFTLAELKDIHAFAASPSGTRYLSRSTAILADPAVAKVNTAMFQDIHDKTQAMIPELGKQVMAYLKAHPDVAKTLEAEAVK